MSVERKKLSSFKELSIQALQRLDLEQVLDAGAVIVDSLKRGGKLLIAGNGGSAADAQHIAAELVGRFRRERKAYAAIALTTDSSVLTALTNDYDFNRVFSRQIEALGKPGDVFLGISTSGRSHNIIHACHMAQSIGLTVIGMTGANVSGVRGDCDQILSADSAITAVIQQCHITMGHMLCMYVEDELCKT